MSPRTSLNRQIQLQYTHRYCYLHLRGTVRNAAQPVPFGSNSFTVTIHCMGEFIYTEHPEGCSLQFCEYNISINKTKPKTLVNYPPPRLRFAPSRSPSLCFAQGGKAIAKLQLVLPAKLYIANAVPKFATCHLPFATKKTVLSNCLFLILSHFSTLNSRFLYCFGYFKSYASV